MKKLAVLELGGGVTATNLYLSNKSLLTASFPVCRYVKHVSIHL